MKWLTFFMLGLSTLLFAGNQWEDEIQAFERKDRENPPPQGAVVFTGSSSIRMWETLEQDFLEFKAINRGFGGSTYQDLFYFRDRLILKYNPSYVVLYSGDNDLASGLSAHEISVKVRDLIWKIHEKQNVPIALVSVKPSPARQSLIPKINELNKKLFEIAWENPNVDYIDVFSLMIGRQGQVKRELFLEDQLHMSQAGYDIWQEVIGLYLKNAIR